MNGITSGNIIIIAQSKSSAAATATAAIVSIMIVMLTCLRTINTQVGIVALISRSITMASVMLVHGD
jgi:hypothetical protein